MKLREIGRSQPTWIALLALSILGGCSASYSPSASQFGSDRLHSEAGSQHLYVSSLDGIPYGGVAVYPLGSTVSSETVTSGLNAPPLETVVDSMGTLYVSTICNRSTCKDGTITEYASGANTPSATIRQPQAPFSIAIGNSGILYALWFSPHLAHGGYIAEYNHGDTKPFFKISQGIDQPHALAVDAHQTLYVASARTHRFPNGAVSEYRPHNTAPLITLSPGGVIAVDTRGFLYVGNGETISEYAAGSSAVLKVIKMPLRRPDSIGCLAVGPTGTLVVGMQHSIGIFPKGSTNGALSIAAPRGSYFGRSFNNALGFCVAADKDGGVYAVLNTKEVLWYPKGSNVGRYIVDTGSSVSSISVGPQ